MEFSYLLSYIGGSITFIIVTFCGEFLFSLNYKRKDKFVLRYSLSLLITLSLSVALTIPYYIVDVIYKEIVWSNIVVIVLYLSMFTLTVIANKLCYDESFTSCLLSGLAGYASQHIFYGTYSIINIATNLENTIYGLFHFSDINLVFVCSNFLCMLIQLAIASIVLTLCYFLVARKTNKISSVGFVQKNVCFITGSTIMIVLIFNVFCDVFASFNIATSIFGKLLLVVCCIFILVFYYNMLEAGSYKNDLDIVNNLNRSERRHFEKLKKDMELISIKCHDIKHYIAMAGENGGVNVSELNELVNIYELTIKTGNEIIDTLIADRSLYCSAHNIKLTVIADASQLDFISASDMCSLFGNMLENAIEAVDKVKDESKRIININIRPVAGQVFFCMENSYAEKPKMDNGMPVSSKGDKQHHGFGMKSIKLIADKYQGSFSCSIDNGVFRINILFPLNKKLTT